MSTKKIQITTPIVTSVNGKTGDVTLDISGGGGGPSVQADWNQNDSSASDYIKNRPCYKEKAFEEITWDGVIGDKYSVSMDSAAGNTTTDYVLVSDKVVSSSAFIGAKISSSTGEEITCTSSNISDGTNNITIMNGTDAVLVVEKTDGGDEILTKKGIYFIRTTKSNSATYTSKLAAPENVVKLDASYLPTATTTSLGAIKIGNGLSITEDGTLSVTTATYYSGTSAPANTLGADGDLYLQTEG